MPAQGISSSLSAFIIPRSPSQQLSEHLQRDSVSIAEATQLNDSRVQVSVVESRHSMTSTDAGGGSAGRREKYIIIGAGGESESSSFLS